jgi:predicted small secreted protein
VDFLIKSKIALAVVLALAAIALSGCVTIRQLQELPSYW